MKVTCKLVDPLEGNTIAPPLELEKEYEVKETHKCACGQEHYNVGLELKINYVECYKCRETLPPTNHWCNSIRFKK